MPTKRWGTVVVWHDSEERSPSLPPGTVQGLDVAVLCRNSSRAGLGFGASEWGMAVGRAAWVKGPEGGRFGVGSGDLTVPAVSGVNEAVVEA